MQSRRVQYGNAQQKVLVITAMEAAETKIKLFGLGDKFDKLTDRTAQRLIRGSGQ